MGRLLCERGRARPGGKRHIFSYGGDFLGLRLFVISLLCFCGSIPSSINLTSLNVLLLENKTTASCFWAHIVWGVSGWGSGLRVQKQNNGGSCSSTFPSFLWFFLSFVLLCFFFSITWQRERGWVPMTTWSGWKIVVDFFCGRGGGAFCWFLW